METSKFSENIMDTLANALSAKKQSDFMEYLEHNPLLKSQYLDLKGTWNDVEKMESKKAFRELDERFYAMLALETESNSSVTFNNYFKLFNRFFDNVFKPNIIKYGLLFFLVGFVLGGLVDLSSIHDLWKDSGNQMNSKNVKEELVLALLELPSPSRRLEAIKYTDDIGSLDNKIIIALLEALNTDTNVNVRLASIRSLEKYSENPEIRKGLIESIAEQDSPIVQIALVELMEKLQEKNSITYLKNLLNSEKTNQLVKKRIESSLQILI